MGGAGLDEGWCVRTVRLKGPGPSHVTDEDTEGVGRAEEAPGLTRCHARAPGTQGYCICGGPGLPLTPGAAGRGRGTSFQRDTAPLPSQVQAVQEKVCTDEGLSRSPPTSQQPAAPHPPPRLSCHGCPAFPCLGAWPGPMASCAPGKPARVVLPSSPAAPGGKSWDLREAGGHKTPCCRHSNIFLSIDRLIINIQ